MAQDNALYDAEWLDIIVHYAKRYTKQRRLTDNFMSGGWELRQELQRRHLPEVGGAEYIAVWRGITDSADACIKDAQDPRAASGAFLWRLIRAADEVDDIKHKRSYQRDMVGLLNSMNLQLSAKDKINALAFFDYTFSADEYCILYKNLGRFDFGGNPETFDYERRQTVRLFYDILNNASKSTWKKRAVAAAPLLETIARNGDLLDGVSYEGREIDADARAKMLAIMTKSGIKFSPACLAYFSEQKSPAPVKDAATYIGALLNKVKSAEGLEKRRSLLLCSFDKVHTLVANRKTTDDRLVDYYSAYISTYASYFPEKDDVSADVLRTLLLQNAAEKNERKKKECLFPELLCESELPRFDKKVVLRVAENYAAAFNGCDDGVIGGNQGFHDQMTIMFRQIVAPDLYSKEEGQAVCDVLQAKGVTQARSMARYVMSGFRQPNPHVIYFNGAWGRND